MLITPFENGNQQWLLVIGIHELPTFGMRDGSVKTRWGYNAAWSTSGTWSTSTNYRAFRTIEAAEKYLRDNRESMRNARLEHPTQPTLLP